MGPKPPDRVLVAMSGGVDSSVAAALLVEQGFDVVGCFMRLGSPGEEVGGAVLGHQGCCSISDAHDARRVAQHLGVPFYAVEFRDEFERIITYFEDAYHAGCTPNPCVRCNDWLKFGRLHDYATAMGCRWVASGHHARIDRSSGTPRLARSTDIDKDQSYVLFGAARPLAEPDVPSRLHQMMLPLGEMTKDEVRAKARALGLGVHAKPDSQEICFVHDNDYARLLRDRRPEAFEPGVMVDEDGHEVARHDGHQHFTIGQRRGLGVAAGHPLYVLDRNAHTNTVTVGHRTSLLSSGCTANEACWHVEQPESWVPCRAQVRAHGDPLPARVRTCDGDSIEVEFATQQEAVAPGQAVVCYEGDLVLCGGWITRVARA